MTSSFVRAVRSLQFARIELIHARTTGSMDRLDRFALSPRAGDPVMTRRRPIRVVRPSSPRRYGLPSRRRDDGLPLYGPLCLSPTIYAGRSNADVGHGRLRIGSSRVLPSSATVRYGNKRA
jgi:hypothetical protein